jgi:hypothetical protein
MNLPKGTLVCKVNYLNIFNEVARLQERVLEVEINSKRMKIILQGLRCTNTVLEVARLGFEPRSTGPKPVMMDPYTIGL